MKKVLINVSFKDRYTGEKHKAGDTEEMSEERIAEVKEVNPHFISVVGNVAKPGKSKYKSDYETPEGKSKNDDENPEGKDEK